MGAMKHSIRMVPEKSVAASAMMSKRALGVIMTKKVTKFLKTVLGVLPLSADAERWSLSEVEMSRSITRNLIQIGLTKLS